MKTKIFKEKNKQNCPFTFSDIDLEKQHELLFRQHHISATQALAMSDWLLDVDARAMDAIRAGKERGFVSTGDAVIVVTGWVKTKKTLSILFFSLYSSFLASGLWYHQYITYHLCRLD